MRQAKILLVLFFAVSICILGPVAAVRVNLWKRAVASGYSSIQSETTARVASVRIPTYAPSVGASVFVGGQNGTWFQQGQFPRLYQVSLSNDSYTQLDPVRSGGTIWGGGFNGSQLLVSGWGSDDDSPGPYIWLYNGAQVVTEGSLDEYGQASSWSGGDIFAASYNGHEWLLTGLGSGSMGSYSNEVMNHMALGTFNGTGFTDLSNIVPEQQDAILYTNAWNGKYWLVGGGFIDIGVLFTFDGKTTHDLTELARSEVESFASIQSIAWNGKDWLIGGLGFLAEYDGHTFTDLTSQLLQRLSTKNFYSVNTIAWDGQSWLIGGGTPIAQATAAQAWFASYSPNGGLVDLTSALPSYVTNQRQGSSILSITTANGEWILGGYVSDRGLLMTFHDGAITDYSDLVSGFTYVDWVSGLQNLTF